MLALAIIVIAMSGYLSFWASRIALALDVHCVHVYRTSVSLY